MLTRDSAGSSQVDVEVRQQDTENFGSNKLETLPFGEFLDHLETQSSSYYLTSQEDDTADSDDGSRPTARSRPPVSHLLDSGVLPSQPPLLENLKCANVNMWMGFSKHGSSSGLHHDFHDNLYLLLRGRKRFKLHAPSDAPRMYTHGTVSKVHTNGLINYIGHDTWPDGAYVTPEASADGDGDGDGAGAGAASADGTGAGAGAGAVAGQRLRLAEQELVLAEQAVSRGVAGAAQRLADAEQELDAALDASLDAQADLGSDGWEDEDEDEDGDDLEEDSAFTAHLARAWSESGARNSPEDIIEEQASKRQRCAAGDPSAEVVHGSAGDADGAAGAEADPKLAASCTGSCTGSVELERVQPMNFSQIRDTNAASDAGDTSEVGANE